jgi:hypothetical protein
LKEIELSERIKFSQKLPFVEEF